MTDISSVLNLLHHFNPSKTALLEWLEPHLDDSLLHEIARADYGHDEEANFQALKLIHERQQVPAPLDWIPREVVELRRWSEPDDPNWKGYPPNSKGARGHLIRAFCCTVLLIAADDPEMQGDPSDENETLIQLIASVVHLGHEASESALRFLSWRVLRLYEEENEDTFFAFGILLLYAFLFEPPQDGADLNLLVDWVLTDTLNFEDWLLGRAWYTQRYEVWKRLGQSILMDPAKHFSEPAATTLQSIVKRLLSTVV